MSNLSDEQDAIDRKYSYVHLAYMTAFFGVLTVAYFTKDKPTAKDEFSNCKQSITNTTKCNIKQDTSSLHLKIK